MNHYRAVLTWNWDRELNIYSKIVKDLGRLEVRPLDAGWEIVFFPHDHPTLQLSYSTLDAALKDADLWVAHLAENAAHSTWISLDSAVERKHD